MPESMTFEELSQLRAEVEAARVDVNDALGESSRLKTAIKDRTDEEERKRLQTYYADVCSLLTDLRARYMALVARSGFTVEEKKQ